MKAANPAGRGALMGFGAAALLLLAFPPVLDALGGASFWVTLGMQIFFWVTMAVSWNFFSGYSGYSSFGHGAFYGIGVYTTSTLMVQFKIPFLAALPFAGLVAALAAVGIGLVIFRLSQFRGELFSLLTLAMTFIIYTIVVNVEVIDGGRGVYVRGADTGGFGEQDMVGLYYVALVITLLTVYVGYYIYYSRWGQALFAIHDDEDVADGLGVPTFQYKLWTFAVSSFFVGVIGGTQAIFLGYLEAANVFSIFIPLLALMMAILGGSGFWYGPIIGAVIITLMRQLFTGGSETAVINQIIIGMVLILTILFMPQGVAGVIEKLRQRGRDETPPPAPVSDMQETA